MSIIGRLRLAIILSLTLALSIAKISGVPHLDPFTNRLLDYPGNTPTIIPTNKCKK